MVIIGRQLSTVTYGLKSFYRARSISRFIVKTRRRSYELPQIERWGKAGAASWQNKWSFILPLIRTLAENNRCVDKWEILALLWMWRSLSLIYFLLAGCLIMSHIRNAEYCALAWQIFDIVVWSNTSKDGSCARLEY
jgi:hypothetical protein